MKPELQRIAIAEICGVKMFGLKKRGMWYRPDARGYTYDARDAGRYSQEEAKEHEYLHGEPDEHVRIIPLPPPDYTNDLNACHAMEAYLDTQPIDVQSLYYDYVALEMGWEAKTPAEAKWQATWNTFRATSQARSAGFVKAVGKWVEG